MGPNYCTFPKRNIFAINLNCEVRSSWIGQVHNPEIKNHFLLKFMFFETVHCLRMGRTDKSTAEAAIINIKGKKIYKFLFNYITANKGG